MNISEDGSHDGIMSERTLAIAGRIYAELQTMISTHGDEVVLLNICKLTYYRIALNSSCFLGNS